MLTLGTLIIVLLIAGLVLAVLGFLLAPRERLWLGACFCLIAAVVLKVFA